MPLQSYITAVYLFFLYQFIQPMFISVSYMYNQVSKMKNKADPNLLSLLQKINNPLDKLNLDIHLKGVFAPPEQWKLTDQANPSLFTYSLEIMNYSFPTGKIELRKMTEKQIKEQEELKNKKASKKQAKEEQKIVADPEAERRKLEWQALPEEQRFYRTQEDPFKAFSLLWNDSHKQAELQKEAIEQLQGNVNDGYLDIVLIRKPEGNEEQIAKIKKAKPKGLNLGELYAAKYKGKLHLSQLSKPGAKSIVQRVALAFSGDIPAQCIKIEADKCYAIIEIKLDSALNPLVAQATPASKDLLSDKFEISHTQKVNLLSKLAEEIKKGVKAISQEYSGFFAKQKEHSQEKKFNSSNSASILNVSTLKINEINKRKEQFLQQFVNSGKYSVLCDKINKTIRAIIIDKIRKEKSGNAINKEAVQKTLAELNVFFRELLQKTLDQYLTAEAGQVHEDLVLNHQFTRSARKQVLSGVMESKEESQMRLANEYEIINKIDKAEEKYINLTLIHNNSLPSLQNYARFCLRHNQHDKAFALYSLINQHSKEFKHRFIVVLFKLHRKREKEALSELLKLDNEEGISPLEKILINLTFSLIYQGMGQEKKSEKHIALAQKYYQLKSNPNLSINPPKNPYIDPIPRIPKPGKYVSQLTAQQSQQIRLSLMNYFVQYNFFGIARSYLPKIGEGERKKYIEALILVGQSNYEDALMLVQSLLQKEPKNLQILLLKAQICFKSERMFEIEEVLLYIKNLKLTANQSYSTYLRLGLTYLNRKSWEDAKQTFNKVVELKNNSSVGWLGLGMANLQLNLLKESEQSFNLSGIYNPLSQESKINLKIISERINGINADSYKYFQKDTA